MILRKNISLNEEYLGKLEPLMQKHKGNLSAVIREVIDLADAAFQDPDSVKKLISGLKKEQNLTSLTLIWALKNLTGRLPDDNTVQNIIGNNIYSLSDLEGRLNELGNEIYWDLSVKISPDNNIQPENVNFKVTGKNPDTCRFLSAIIATFSAQKYKLSVSDFRIINASCEFNMIKGEEDRALKSVVENFGYMDGAFSELYKKPGFWNIIVQIYIMMDYEMVVIPRHLFEDILSRKTTNKITTCIERYCGYPINKISSEDFLIKVKILFQTIGLIEDMDINKNSLIIHHRFTNREAIGWLASMFEEILRQNGQTYNSIIGENLIILKQLPEVSKILVRMAEDLTVRDEPAGNYYSNLVKMLNLLRNVPSNDEFLKSLSSKFGKKIIQNYKKDNNISSWDVSTFEKYMKDMSAILKHESKWSIVGENIIFGQIFTCPLVKDNAQTSNINCTFIKGLYDGWISDAFGDKIERVHTMSKTINSGDCCEIYVYYNHEN
jgi:hypothetical protein